MLMFLSLSVLAAVGWFMTGFALLGSKRADYISPIWRISLQGMGLLLAICATIAASLVGRWWWGLVILLIAPNTAILAIMGLFTPRAG
jgi:hypothetical protein